MRYRPLITCNHIKTNYMYRTAIAVTDDHNDKQLRLLKNSSSTAQPCLLKYFN